MTGSRVDLASIDFLQFALHSLKSADVTDDGAMLSDQLWSGVVHDKEVYLANASCLHDGINRLTQLRAVRHTLFSMLSSLESAQSHLRKATFPGVLARGVESLPNEILSLILTFASQSSWDGVLKVSWVSRRFRSIALATPRLWCTLPPARLDLLSCEALATFLARSKNVGLYIELPLMVTENYEQNQDWKVLVDILLEHKHRWKEVSLDPVTIHEAIQVGPNQEPIQRTMQFPAAVLDSVKQLNIGDSPYRSLWPSYGSDDDWYDDASKELYEGWSFPNVRTLVSEMHIPPPRVFPSLTEFSLDLSLHAPADTLTYRSESHPSPLDALVEFLNSVPALASLRLSVGEYSYGQFSRAISLHSLKRLHLENRYTHEESLHTLQAVARAMSIPSIECITLSLMLSNANELLDIGGGKWLESFFPMTRAYQELKQFRLEYVVDNEPTSKVIKEFDRFPKLEEVDVCTRSAPSITGMTAVTLHNTTTVQKLRFRDAHSNYETAVREYTFEENGPILRSFTDMTFCYGISAIIALPTLFATNTFATVLVRQTTIYSLGLCRLFLI